MSMLMLNSIVSKSMRVVLSPWKAIKSPSKMKTNLLVPESLYMTVLHNLGTVFISSAYNKEDLLLLFMSLLIHS